MRGHGTRIDSAAVAVRFPAVAQAAPADTTPRFHRSVAACGVV